jgi:hypothetical protein
MFQQLFAKELRGSAVGSLLAYSRAPKLTFQVQYSPAIPCCKSSYSGHVSREKADRPPHALQASWELLRQLVGFKKSSISIGIKDAYEEDKDSLLLKRDLDALLKVNPPPPSPKIVEFADRWDK